MHATAHPVTDTPPLIRRNEGPVAVLTLSRPEIRNCLSEETIRALTETMDDIAQDKSIRAVVLAAEGSVFSSGHDLKEMTAHRADADDGRAFYSFIMRQCSAMMQKIITLPQPVIAAVEGVATAAGCQLVATCDLAIAGEDARFCTPGVNLGLFCSTPSVALSRNLSRKHALEMLLTGEMTGAADALRFGLVNRIAPRGEALAHAKELARKIAAKSSRAVAAGKRAYYAQIEMPLAEAYDHASQVMVENMLAFSAREGIEAFLEKRPPDWRGG